MHLLHFPSSPLPDSWLHRVDPRAKLLLVLCVACPCLLLPYRATLGLLPLAAFPLLVLVRSGCPPRAIARAWLTPVPFVLFLAAWHPWLDPSPAWLAGWPGELTAGWVRFWRILLSALVLIGFLLALVATTSAPALLSALARLGAPRWLVLILGFNLRYLALLLRRGADLRAARALRAAGGAPLSRNLRLSAGMLTQFLARTLADSEQVEHALTLRGFDGRCPTLGAGPLRRLDFAVIAAGLAIALLPWAASWLAGFAR
ncbi:MAG TPA: energy-coupling factor transporter transmembrane component T [Candidatus Sumerlaeota bacterium]|nr:energy-coupling factor transporter transmembrane component T [Candidatus Sumerlaeota bacterium]HOR28733.1 energy-coupling factor transporter transmembrane component T [Candidatus Sumerlaeota bacterium]HPK02291.1 energy-coupling factor transporter transmembrane component T [Candidatus Sumerlaeota bacterium]